MKDITVYVEEDDNSKVTIHTTLRTLYDLETLKKEIIGAYSYGTIGFTNQSEYRYYFTMNKHLNEKLIYLFNITDTLTSI